MSLEPNPLISVIMPVYNAAPYVAEAVESVRSQSYENWELIIVNDGSSDASAEVIKAISDTRIRYFYQENAGVSKARNAGLDKIRGDYVCFLDADDTFPHESLKARLDVFLKKPDTLIVDGFVRVFDSSLKNILREWRPFVRGHVTKFLVRLTGNCFFGPTWMIRVRAPFVNRFDEEMTHAEDLLFFTEVSTLGSYDFAETFVYNYRKSATSAMSNTRGLARGYEQYRQKIRKLTGVGWAESVSLLWRSRKIIFLTYLSERKILGACAYLLTGKA